MPLWISVYVILKKLIPVSSILVEQFSFYASRARRYYFMKLTIFRQVMSRENVSISTLFNYLTKLETKHMLYNLTTITTWYSHVFSQFKV